jgi:hypothetical protein
MAVTNCGVLTAAEVFICRGIARRGVFVRPDLVRRVSRPVNVARRFEWGRGPIDTWGRELGVKMPSFLRITML